MKHHLTMTVEIKLDLTVETGTGPEQVAKGIQDAIALHLPNDHRTPPVLTLGPWHLTNDDGTFSGKIG